MAAQIGAPGAAVRAHEELFAYWASLRQGARLPGRRHLDPAGIKRLLPTVSLIDVGGAPGDYRMRLAGTGLYGVYGREITGHTLEEVYNTERHLLYVACTRARDNLLVTAVLPGSEFLGDLVTKS